MYKNICKINNQRDITQKLRQEKQPFLRAVHCLYLIRIPIKLHENILDSEWVTECTKMLITQNEHKTQSKGHYSEMKKVKATVIVRDTLSCPDIHSYKVS